MTAFSPDPSKADAIGARLLDVVVRLNRWANHHTAWPLPPAQARVLSQIDGLGTTCISDLARAEHCSQPTMTAQVHRLQQQGFIQRTPSKEDARVTWISLTGQGHEVLTRVRSDRAATIESLIHQLGTHDQQALREAVHALSQLLAAAYPQAASSQDPRKP
ncbi:MAG TPA: MarR family transcriptional regulator [Castellaniella sp.]|uniref:MarR family winged helix-turn-helix transcriptional regulator n=1 Tax=Castellaniella sp. TaxID=1955812 RepID=UPI002F102042